MEKCPSTQDTVRRSLEGGLTAAEQEALRDHLALCPSCRAALAQLDLVEEVVKDALVPPDSVEPALARIAERLKEAGVAPARPAMPQLSARAGIRRWAARAALLLIGVGLGFVFQGQRATSVSNTVSREPIAIQVAEVHGTVLVKRRNTQVWQILKPDAAIYLGDTFHTTATSGLVLGLDEDAQVKVSQNSMLVVESYDDEKTEFYLEHGQCTPVLNGPHGPFFIRTPNGRMEALGTEFTVKVTE